MADSAAGFVVILGLIFLVSRGIPLPVVGHALESLRDLSGHAPLFILFIVFLLATPIGLLINGLSWFLFGWCRIYLTQFWFSLPEKWYNPFFPTKLALHYKKIVAFFQLGSQEEIIGKTIYERSELFGDYLVLFFEHNALCGQKSKPQHSIHSRYSNDEFMYHYPA